MLDVEDFRQYARNFLLRSRQLKDPQTKAAMIRIAMYWTELAAQAENSQLIAQQHVVAGDG
jgi:hypothetical protein